MSGLVLMVFHNEARSQRQAWHQNYRQGQLEKNPNCNPESRTFFCRIDQVMQKKSESQNWCSSSLWGFLMLRGTEDSSCLFEIFMPHQSWWKDTFPPPTPPHLFLLRKCGSRAAVGQKQIWGLDAGKGSESHISQREAIWVNAHLLMHTYRCKHKCAFPHTFAHIHVLLTGSDGWCAQNSPPLCDPLPPLHHLSVGLGGGPLTF